MCETVSVNVMRIRIQIAWHILYIKTMLASALYRRKILRLPSKRCVTDGYIYTSFYCSCLRLPSENCGSGRYVFTTFYCACLLVRRMILRLYF